MKSQIFYTGTMELYLSKDISVLSIAPIGPQIYTGSAVTPRVNMRYLDQNILLTSIFKVRYENNTEKGTAKVIVEVDDEDMKGEIVCEFQIKDVSEIYPGTTMDSWYFNDLTAMQSVGAMNGIDNPEAYITRAEFVHMLYEYYNPSGGTGILTFTDVSNESPFAPAIKWAMKAGVIRGITDKTIQTAVALELLHTASLIHDDVVDDTPIRRGSNAVHTQWTNKVAILVGD